MIADLLTKAAKAERVAKALLDDGEFDDAVSRAYYAMFNAARCLVISADAGAAESTSHKGVLIHFHRLFIATGKLDKRFGQMIQRAQNARHAADYADGSINQRDAQIHVENAAAFLVAAHKLIPASMLPPPLGRSPREIQMEVAKEDGGKRSAVEMLAAVVRGLNGTPDSRLAEDLVLYGTEASIAAIIEALTADPKLLHDLPGLARRNGVELPENKS